MIPPNLRNGWVIAVCLLALHTVKYERAWAADIERWGIYEVNFDRPSEGNPYTEVQLSATFHLGKQAVAVAGFYDGDGVYRVRFSPPTSGEWRYETKSNQPGLNAKSGKFTVNQPTGSNHGPVRVFDTFYLRYADGTPYHQFGTTCYAWVHQPLDCRS